MEVNYNGNQLGAITIEQRGKQFQLQIRQDGCLAAFVYEDGEHQYLFDLFKDEKHIKNIIKNQGRLFLSKVIKCQLNLKYKESKTLLKYLTKEGVNVVCCNE